MNCTLNLQFLLFSLFFTDAINYLHLDTYGCDREYDAFIPNWMYSNFDYIISSQLVCEIEHSHRTKMYLYRFIIKWGGVKWWHRATGTH